MISQSSCAHRMSAIPSRTKVSVKGLVKFVSRFLSVTVEDIANPTSERTQDIFWNICCFIYGESYLLDMMRGKEKRICLTLPMKRLFDRLLPTLQPAFTMRDLVFPTKERVIILYSALMGFVKVWDAQMHIRDNVNEELRCALLKEQKLKNAIVDATQRVQVARENRDRDIDRCQKLQDKFMTLETAAAQTKHKVNAMQVEVERIKMTLAERKAHETELKAAIKSEEEKIEYLQANALPPKAEFEAKLASVAEEVDELQEQLRQKQSAHKEYERRIDGITRQQKAVKSSTTTLEEVIRVMEKNREDIADCEEMIRGFEKAGREVQAQNLETRQEESRFCKATELEKSSLEQRIADLESENEQHQVVKEDILSEIERIKKERVAADVMLGAIDSEREEAVAEFNKLLHLEKSGWRHLENLKMHVKGRESRS
ncbi:myosin heavy chain, clone 203-like [Watersipora subatra]|uniref:myosin heavy chain, clone 203-like n=1 Tax=Watersipora subatra TaxID=2589382 RepID=UPI00355C7058